jgi:hypothetical protein
MRMEMECEMGKDSPFDCWSPCVLYCVSGAILCGAGTSHQLNQPNSKNRTTHQTVYFFIFENF